MLRPASPQQWDAVEGFRQSLSAPRDLKETRTLALIAVGSLAIAGIFAFLLVLGRVIHADALFDWLAQSFDKFLIIHVNFSFLVWFLAGAMLFMQIGALRRSDGAPMLGGLGRAGTAAALAGCAILAASAFTDGLASKNNYIPAVIDPVFYLSLLAFAFAAATAAVRILANAASGTGALEPVGATGVASAVIVIAALFAFAVSWQRGGGVPSTPAANEDVFWAGGHILQFLNTAIMIGAWSIMGGRALGRPAVQPRIVMAALGLCALLAVGGCTLLFVAEPLSGDERYLFTQYQYALAPAPTLIGLLLAIALLRDRIGGTPVARLARTVLWTSLVVFFTGGILGIFVDGADTRTPAHYHGVIGGVNVALMGLILLFVLPLLERGLTRFRAASVAVVLYGAGQFLHSLGLFIAGGYGAPRKVAGAADLETIGNWIGHAGIGIGGAIAVIGGILFIWIAGRRLLARTA